MYSYKPVTDVTTKFIVPMIIGLRIFFDPGLVTTNAAPNRNIELWKIIIMSLISFYLAVKFKIYREHKINDFLLKYSFWPSWTLPPGGEQYLSHFLRLYNAYDIRHTLVTENKERRSGKVPITRISLTTKMAESWYFLSSFWPTKTILRQVR